MRLDLREPLKFEKISFEENGSNLNITEHEEVLLCYELNSDQSRSIEPDCENFLGSFLFSGRKIEGQITEQVVSLPQGIYLFMQQRSAHALNQAEWVDLAIEQQKDGLWERNKLENLLYIRFLHEDGAFVTQVFRSTETE